MVDDQKSRRRQRGAGAGDVCPIQYAFTNPQVAATIGQSDYGPLGGAIPGFVGPGYHRLDFSLFKNFKTSENTSLQFRAEFFNITNHPNLRIAEQ